MHDRTRISQKWIRKAEEAGACEEAVEWLREKPQTWGKLKREHPEWYVWAMRNIPGYPIELTVLRHLISESAAERRHRLDRMTARELWLNTRIARFTTMDSQQVTGHG